MVSAKRLAGNVFAGMAVNVTRILIQLAMIPIMGRLLGPDQIGLYAVAMPMFTFVLVLADAGLDESLARETSDDTKVWSSAFWGLLACGTVLAVIVYASSFVIARVAGQPLLPSIMLPLSFTLIAIALTVIPGALMLRSGQLVLGAAGEFVANVLSAGLALVLAFHGFGVWALVAQTLSMFVTRTIFLNLFFPYIPKFEFDARSLLGHWNVSGAIVGSRLLELGTRISENSMVSRLLGANILGSYGYANQIGRFFSDALGNPVWANLYLTALKTDPRDVARHYVRFHRILAMILFPAATLAALAMPTIIPMTMGDRWSNAIAPIMILLITYPFYAIAGLFGAVLLARNSSRTVMLGLLTYCLGRIVVVTLTFRLGLTGMAFGLAICNVAYYAWVVFFVSASVGNKASDLVELVTPSLAATVTVGVAAHLALGVSPSFAWLVFVEAAAGVAYCAVLLLIDNRNTCEIARTALSLFRREAMA